MRRSPVPSRWPQAVQRLLIGALCALSLATGCTSRPRYRTGPPPPEPAEKPAEEAERQENTPASISTNGAYQVGLSSYYAHKFHGRPTASGEIFDMNGLTAAHRELPLGTIVKVTHLDNGRSVVVKVNDRGPFIEGRILDLSLGAAREIEMVEAGVARVKIEILKPVE